MCCERQTLQPPLWVIGTPSQNTVAFGIFAKGRNRILGYGEGHGETAVGYQLPIDRMDDGFIKIPLNDTVLIHYRMFNLVIGKTQLK